MSTAEMQPNRVRQDASEESEASTEIETFPFMTLSPEDGREFYLSAYLVDVLKTPPEDESELLLHMRSRKHRPRLGDFAKCVVKWESRGLEQHTPIRGGNMQLPLFHWVALTGSCELVDWLLSRGYDPFLGLPNTNWTPMHAIVMSLRWIFPSGFNSMWRNMKWMTYLESIVNKLANTLGVQDVNMDTPIHLAARRADLEDVGKRYYEPMLNSMVWAVKAQGDCANMVMAKQDKDGNTVLHLLAGKCSLSPKPSVNCIRAGAPLDIVNNDNETAYQIAIRHSLDDLADYLEIQSDFDDKSSNNTPSTTTNVPSTTTNIPSTTLTTTPQETENQEIEKEEIEKQEEIPFIRASRFPQRSSAYNPCTIRKKRRVSGKMVRATSAKRKYVMKSKITRRKSASRGLDYRTTASFSNDPLTQITLDCDLEGQSQDFTTQECSLPIQLARSSKDQSTPPPQTNTENIKGGSSSEKETIDVSTVMEILVGSGVWKQVPSAAVQAKQKLQADLECYQKEVTVISRAMETTQQELEERRHHLKHLQNDIYSIREQVHQLEDQEQRYRQRGRILSNQLQEILEKMRRLDKFTGGMASNSSVREDV